MLVIKTLQLGSMVPPLVPSLCSCCNIEQNLCSVLKGPLLLEKLVLVPSTCQLETSLFPGLLPLLSRALEAFFQSR